MHVDAVSAEAPVCTPPEKGSSLRPERYRRFGDELDAVKRRIVDEVGVLDLEYVRKLDWFSHAMEVVGRVLIHVSFEPFSFALGVGALWVHKQLQATEIGHTALHGAYDRMPGARRFHSETFRWDTPIDEESWRSGHNVRHHGFTNIAGKDPDILFGTVRLTEHTPYARHHKYQLPFTLAVLFPNFGFLMNTHFTGLTDVLLGNGRGGLDVLPDLSKASVRGAWKKTLRKYLPYYFKNYVFFPALAGPFFWKVLLGNWLAEVMRDVYSAATIFCGHVGDDVKAYDLGTKARSRGDWYAMQVESTNNYEVSRPISILCGGLDRQIEHHLFPTLPPERLRQIAPEVRAICERHGVKYRTDTWPRTLARAILHVQALANEDGLRGVMRDMA
jgi:linoleoyl-CoA desaturase